MGELKEHCGIFITKSQNQNIQQVCKANTICTVEAKQQHLHGDKQVNFKLNLKRGEKCNVLQKGFNYTSHCDKIIHSEGESVML